MGATKKLLTEIREKEEIKTKSKANNYEREQFGSCGK